MKVCKFPYKAIPPSEAWIDCEDAAIFVVEREAWISFAAASIIANSASSVETCAENADMMLAEFRKRFYTEPNQYPFTDK